MSSHVASVPLSLFAYPYRGLVPLTGGRQQLREGSRQPGTAVLWHLGLGFHSQDVDIVRKRPGGVPLIAILPPTSEIRPEAGLVRVMEATRPHGILPFHEEPSPEELTDILRSPPENLGLEVTDYLSWRGIPFDRETGRLIRKTVDLSAELRSISALARALYMSRRALGRRFMSRGLPVPSHWLHFARLLRVAIRLQNSDESVLSVGYDLGYPDGFSLSNQLVRLTGFRPVDVRRHLGWEWLMEAWLRREADTGGLAPELTVDVLGQPAFSLEAESAAFDDQARPSRTRRSIGRELAG